MNLGSCQSTETYFLVLIFPKLFAKDDSSMFARQSEQLMSTEKRFLRHLEFLVQTDLDFLTFTK